MRKIAIEMGQYDCVSASGWNSAVEEFIKQGNEVLETEKILERL